MEQLQQIFSQNQLRLTVPRKTVFDVLHKAEKPLFIADIQRQCPHVDRVSIYRTLDLFSTLGIIEIIHTGFKKRYELAAPFQPHHHHLQCTSCGELVTIHTPELEHYVESLAASHNYQLTAHHIELHGHCQKCQA